VKGKTVEAFMQLTPEQRRKRLALLEALYRRLFGEEPPRRREKGAGAQGGATGEISGEISGEVLG
jgi:hypothetical protein